MNRPARLLGVSVAALVLVTLASPSAVSGAPPAGPAGTQRTWIVTLEPDIAPGRSAGRLARNAGGSAGRTFEHALNGFVFGGSKKAAEALARIPKVRSVVADRPIHAVAETIPAGIRRIDARHPSAADAHDSGFTGAGVRIGILDTGIDLSHPDLVANLDTSLGKNCYGSGPPQDGHGHGTHVAGIAAGVGDNGQGVVGVAHQSRIVPIKVLSDSGSGQWSNAICGIDYLTGLMLDGDPTNDVQVANMSLGDTGSIGDCADGGLREAICTSVAAGITYVAAAGNSTTDASTFIPAAFPEVMTVSATVDHDGEPGGLGGCALWIFYCDDTLAEFSNYGLVVDVAAPGYQIFSTWTGGGYQAADGTSMAAPHVAGVAALVRAARPSLSPADVEELLETTGECPNGQYADADGSANCSGKGQRKNDPDGYGEPLVNALRAARAASDWNARPSVRITSPIDGESMSGLVDITADASDDQGVTQVMFAANGYTISTDTDGSDGWSASWDTVSLAGGTYSLSATAIDTGGRAGSDQVTVALEPDHQGDWVGNFGSEGYILGGWNGTNGDLAVLPAGVTYTLEQGTRVTGWPSPTTDVRALESPDEAERRARTWYHSGQVRVRLNFTNAYSGTVHLYSVDWDSTARRQKVTVDDGVDVGSVSLMSAFSEGAWTHFPVTVPTSGSVLVTVERTAGANSVLSGIFLGGPGTPPPPPPPPPAPTVDHPGVQGDWVGNFGSEGYILGGWNGTNGDLAVLPAGVTYTLEQGTRVTGWPSPTTDVRALESPDEAERRARTWYHSGQVRVRLNFTNAYSGTVHLYSVDWDSTARRQKVTVDDGRGPQTVGLTTSFNAGVWMHYDIALAAGNSVVITADLISGANAVLSGVFLGAPKEPAATVPGAPQGVTAVAGDASVQLSWSAPADDGGSTITGYNVYRGTSPGAGALLAALGDVLAYSDARADNGTTYYYTVAAANTVGVGSFSSEVPATPVAAATVPGAPQDLTAVAGDASVQLTWSAPADDGGSTITGYTATASPADGSCASLETSCSITGLKNGTTYTFTVTATNAAGTGPASESVSATPVGLPGAPQNLVASPHRNKGIDLTWSAPATGGSPITSYRIYRGTTSGSHALLATVGTVTSYRDPGTKKNVRYYYIVVAVNGVGAGPSSNEATAIAK